MKYEIGERVMLVQMEEDPDPIPAGSVGTVRYVQDLSWPGTPIQTQVSVDWDSGRRMSCLVPPDVLVRVTPKKS